jgi:ATP-dependent DNA helicase RecQ
MTGRSKGTHRPGIGRLNYLGAVGLVVREQHQAPQGNSAQRLRQVHDAFTLGAELEAANGAHQGPILFVDDAVDTGWSMTVAARLLRQACAEAVLPLVLAVRG